MEIVSVKILELLEKKRKLEKESDKIKELFTDVRSLIVAFFFLWRRYLRSV